MRLLPSPHARQTRQNTTNTTHVRLNVPDRAVQVQAPSRRQGFCKRALQDSRPSARSGGRGVQAQRGLGLAPRGRSVHGLPFEVMRILGESPEYLSLVPKCCGVLGTAAVEDAAIGLALVR